MFEGVTYVDNTTTIDETMMTPQILSRKVTILPIEVRGK